MKSARQKPGILIITVQIRFNEVCHGEEDIGGWIFKLDFHLMDSQLWVQNWKSSWKKSDPELNTKQANYNACFAEHQSFPLEGTLSTSKRHVSVGNILQFMVTRNTSHHSNWKKISEKELCFCTTCVLHRTLRIVSLFSQSQFPLLFVWAFPI